jgi:hypothetical protein
MENRALLSALTNLAEASQKVVAIKESGMLSVTMPEPPSHSPNG